MLLILPKRQLYLYSDHWKNAGRMEYSIRGFRILTKTFILEKTDFCPLFKQSLSQPAITKRNRRFNNDSIDFLQNLRNQIKTDASSSCINTESTSVDGNQTSVLTDLLYYLSDVQECDLLSKVFLWKLLNFQINTADSKPG